MKTKLDILKEALKEGNTKKVMHLSSSLSNEDILEDLVQKGHLRPATHCNLCGKELGLTHQKFGVGS